MSYYLDLFSPETYAAYRASDRSVSGFRYRQRNAATRINPGDKFVCYLTRLSRWAGVLEVVSGPFQDNTPIFEPKDDPFVVRFKVKPLTLLDLEKAVPIHAASVWSTLTFTREHNQGSSTGWTGKVRGSLVRLDEEDGKFLEALLTEQAAGGKTYPLSEDDQKKLRSPTVSRPDKVVSVSVPEEADDVEAALPQVPDVRESAEMQALLAKIGADMGFKIWLPKADRSAVLQKWKPGDDQLLDRLPLNYDDTTLRTIEQIDVLWLQRRSITRAFEVEHTTSVYSGILRMADLLALQPNMNIKLHIVAPQERRDKVFQELRRPVFALLERGPLADSCTYLSYDSLRELSKEKHLSRMSDEVLDDYAEEAE